MGGRLLLRPQSHPPTLPGLTNDEVDRRIGRAVDAPPQAAATEHLTGTLVAVVVAMPGGIHLAARKKGLRAAILFNFFLVQSFKVLKISRAAASALDGRSARARARGQRRSMPFSAAHWVGAGSPSRRSTCSKQHTVSVATACCWGTHGLGQHRVAQPKLCAGHQ